MRPPRLKLFKTKSRFIFQEGDRFYVAKAREYVEELKSYGVVDKTINYEIIEGEIETKNTSDLCFDIRILGSNTENWIEAFKKGKRLINEVGESLSTGKDGTFQINDSLSNPRAIYKEIIAGIKSHISPSAKILPGARIAGNSFIGERCVIGNNALVRNSYIDDETVVGYNTEITASYIGRGVTLHTNFIGNSMIGDNCHLGYISCTTTLRLDGQNVAVKLNKNQFNTGVDKVGSFVEIGCNLGAYVVLMPGAFVGRDSVINPYTSIKGFVPRRSYCRSILKTEVVPFIEQRNTPEQYRKFKKLLEKELYNNYGRD